jgi:4-hydroxy-tetrahydrodipicolinate reductase
MPRRALDRPRGAPKHERKEERIMADDTRPLRVVQWATGNIGTRAMRAVIEHPGMELVGLHVHSADKAGRDAGEIAGTDANGIKATTAIADVLALSPDCVLYMQQGTDIDDLATLLEAGINVVTTRGDFHHPPSMDPAVRARIEAACAKGGASIHSSGSSPGFISEAVPIVLASLSRRIDCVTIDEFADVSSRDTPQMLFDVMGFGGPAGAIEGPTLDYVKGGFADTLIATADALGIAIDEVVAEGAFAPARTDVTIAAGTIPAGTAAAQRIVISAKAAGVTRMRFRANWYCTRDVDVDWELRESGWRVQVAGDTPLDVAITFPVAAEDYAAFTPNLTAHRPVNAIPAVCAAAPGIRTTADLPQVIAILR